MQGRNSYAIEIRAQQQKQKQFAFSELKIQNELTREQPRNDAGFKFQPVKIWPQHRERIRQVQGGISEIETLGSIRKEQP